MRKLFSLMMGPWGSEMLTAERDRTGDLDLAIARQGWTELRWPSTGLLALRLVAGTAMLLHGAPKILAPTTWLGDAVPGWLQALAAVAEFGGGAAWMIGALTPLASAGVFLTMLTGIGLLHVPSGDPLIRLTVTGVAEGPGGTFANLPRWVAVTDGAIMGGSGSSELALLFSAIALALFFAGPGRYSVDSLWRKRRSARA